MPYYIFPMQYYMILFDAFGILFAASSTYSLAQRCKVGQWLLDSTNSVKVAEGDPLKVVAFLRIILTQRLLRKLNRHCYESQ